MGTAITLTRNNFEREVLQSDVPVIVDYWAPWCGPCHLLRPVLEAIAEERDGSLKVGKVNVDDERTLALQAGVRGIPYVVLYRDGAPVASVVGALPQAILEDSLGLDVADDEGPLRAA